MCNPAMIALTVVSIAGTAYSSYQQKKAANKAADFNTKMAKRNAAIADTQAEDALERGRDTEQQHREQVARFKGTQRAGFAASGVLVDEGSSADALIDTAGRAEVDAQAIRRNAAQEAWSLRETGTNLNMQADMYQSTKSSPWASAGTSVLTQSASFGASYVAGGGLRDTKTKIA